MPVTPKRGLVLWRGEHQHGAVCGLFGARGVQLSGASHREPGEIIEVHPALIAEALEMAHSGQIKDDKSALALLLCEPYLQMAED